MFIHNRIRLAVLMVGIMVATSDGVAHTGATGIVKERMDAMSLLGDHAKAVGDMLKNKTPFDRGEVQRAAAAFVLHGEQIPTLFPDTEASRTGSKTEALPAIWTDWEDFVAIAQRFTDDSRAFADLAAELGTDEKGQSRVIRAAFFRASKSCSGCHERFRLDQD